MLPLCIVCLATTCHPTKDYIPAFREANRQTPRATCEDKLLAGIALGLITPCCLGSFSGQILPTSCLDPIYCVPSCIFFNVFPKKDPPCFPDGCLTTGCFRDFTVLKKTFLDPQEKIDRTT